MARKTNPSIGTVASVVIGIWLMGSCMNAGKPDAKPNRIAAPIVAPVYSTPRPETPQERAERIAQDKFMAAKAKKDLAGAQSYQQQRDAEIAEQQAFIAEQEAVAAEEEAIRWRQAQAAQAARDREESQINDLIRSLEGDTGASRFRSSVSGYSRVRRGPDGVSKSQRVSGYTRKDGTRVDSYYRRPKSR